ncbi:MAG: UDP-N-acetylglucosamine diphosphorylase/glucosamine-1-phosphate N-acetyltransferase [Clostridiales bacterium]|nr:MAG: UDP-N-acetylglucosamine diphosphorylase/glucosamine-1-phosphate N-acetyltransferase [Clostridiales bacterium]
MSETIAVILAAGDGKRMMSKQPKVLCEVLFKPMLSWVLSACEASGVGEICVVAGYEHEQVEHYLNGAYPVVLQTERRGTGHAVMMAADFLKAHAGSNLLILCGDAPFMDAETLRGALAQHEGQGNSVTVITANLENPEGYGRIVRKGSGISGIVEQKDATDDQLRITEINSGAYWFKTDDLLSVLWNLKNDNAQGEFYLTDTISALLAAGKRAGAYCAANACVALGANDRKALLALNRLATERIIDKHLENGVGFVSTDGVMIGPDVTIEPGTVILPNTILKGRTAVGANCEIGPGCLLENARVGDETRLNYVQAYDCVIHSQVKMGPFVHIRPNSEIHSGVKIGDFVEVKNSVVGSHTAIAHLTYVGDSDVGSHVNFGCGVVTVNYDGVNKMRTTIGDHAFIGCNTNLVAPVKIGNTAYTGAGSTITKDVPDGALAVERADQVMIKDYAYRKLRNKKER